MLKGANAQAYFGLASEINFIKFAPKKDETGNIFLFEKQFLDRHERHDIYHNDSQHTDTWRNGLEH
jgi:hypothetical protein